MHNRRDSLSADMKGTIAIGQVAQNESTQQNEEVEDKKENDLSDDDSNSSENVKEASNDQGRDDQDNDDIGLGSHRSVVVGDQERLKLDWRIGEWSRCSQTCGPEGRKVCSLLII